MPDQTTGYNPLFTAENDTFMKTPSNQKKLNWLVFSFLTSLFVSFSGLLQADESKKEWFQGGTLHDAVVSEWKVATAENKLATASDWLSSTLWKGKLSSYGDFEKLKAKTQMLVDAIDGAVQGVELGNTKAIEIAAAIVTTSNDLGP